MIAQTTSRPMLPPSAVFEQAESFRKAFVALYTPPPDEFLAGVGAWHTPYQVPRVVCGAFSIELYLKCLILIENQKPVRGHSLVDLFSTLSFNSQVAIEKHWLGNNREQEHRRFRSQMEGKPAMTFADVLQENDRAFEEWRYLYENQPAWSGGGLILAIRWRLIDLDPSLGAQIE